MSTALTVGDVARLAGVTVRALHHYDEVGLVCPSRRSEAGYRLYGEQEIERLQEVLFYRELGFSLDSIAAALSEREYERRSALLRQRALLEQKRERLDAMINTIERTIEGESRGVVMTPEEKLEVFGDFDPSEYEDEARERWGESEAYRQSSARTDRYTKDDWARNKAEVDALHQAFLALMGQGVSPDSTEAMDVAERHRRHISGWFYDCSKEIHAGLAEMYVADTRFTENIDQAGEGLAEYMSEAILANALRE